MEIFNSIAGFIGKLIQWWFVVMPWEQGIRVRKGNKVKLLEAGLYFKIPFIDAVYIQTTRMRMIDVAMQSVTTNDGGTITIKSAIGYSIKDILRLYNTMAHPEMTLGSIVMSYVSDFVGQHKTSEINQTDLEEAVNKRLLLLDHGLKDVNMKVTTFASVKTFRLIQDGSWLNEGLRMDEKK